MAFNQFYQWISSNQPPANHPYSKGWWDWVEWCQWLVPLVRAKNVLVASTFTMTTPPPTTKIDMPILELEMATCSIRICWLFSLDSIAPSYFAWIKPKGDYLLPKSSFMNELFGASSKSVSESYSFAKNITNIHKVHPEPLNKAYGFWNAYDLYAFLKNPFE